MKIFAQISWLFATILIFVSLALMILIYPIVPRPYARKITSWLLRLSLFYSLDVQGEEDPEAQIFLVNHQSDLDIGIMETLTSKDLAWVAKKELFDVPFFGLALKLPQDIAVERESKTALIKLLRAAKDRLEKGRVITMFPEGTRSTTGKMLPFKAGAKVIADKYKLRVQPIVLMQTSKYYNIKKFYYKPGRIKVIYMDSFIADKESESWLSDLRIKMQGVYDDELANNPSHR
ncbi:MAG: 1-acyl-sn-glycerol-3-phosphate acyltransferase [Epsilonproteobacteria bacterium]|nr:1-acyl-sn-glycerol-3-phosphate acyltransferase [Campylobacterota bacterium]OIO17155.1 MAG: 1-acyl-sn-glycerol-3-phosphate acyltransferase [Helicobacteraceae bacterium CG1_02_36_14]PIP10126.1 MAG: 1-acyl-sn-glycerol-3-phosphate acyltransferase [Sulfurimonas sp. CG23_combo_of_CG06-09_8_20_14_all_36_33]PIS26555.1 MAG: 1-acyl-sn-glycerol-3-phosphate acyltransferase [Sulfurimonas sp. CG08_land_8_20_14_0_20_36_33]PIU34016.1 MAG: 1-acyl-sn-glycerol-3-phosphate acyltransferase [Sulfurimonas sp. CG07